MSRRPAILGAQVAQSHGRRQSHAVDEEGVDRRVGESSAPGLISVDRSRSSRGGDWRTKEGGWIGAAAGVRDLGGRD
jgi:hypothetical protein